MATLTETQDAYDRHNLRVGMIHSDVADVILKLEAERDALREVYARIASDVAIAHQRIGTHGRFTDDYRTGAVDSARHIAHLIRNCPPKGERS